MTEKSNTGMTNLAPEMTNMTPKQAMKVIKDAKKLGVTKMKLGTLEFEIKESEPRAPRPASKVSKAVIQQMDEKIEVQQQFTEQNDELSTLHVEDPQAFEDAMVRNELEDGDTGETFEETQNI